MVKILQLVKIHEKQSLLQTAKRPLPVVSEDALPPSLWQQMLCEATHADRRMKCKTTARFVVKFNF